MRFRSLSALTLSVAVTVAVQPVMAQLYEGFKLTFPLYGTGTGFSGTWQVGGFNAFAAGYIAHEKSLSFSRLETTGGHVAGAAFPSINGATRNLNPQLGADNTTAYLSFLVRPLGTLNAGIFNGFFGVTLGGGGNELFAGKPGGGAIEEYVVEHRGGAGQVSSGIPTGLGQTTLLVVRADFLPGNDLFTLYVNPVPGTLEPANGAVKADLNLGVVSRLGIYSTGAFAIDEIRIGATYADVTPVSAFAGTPGAANCHGKTISALAATHGGLEQAAAALGHSSVAALQNSVASFCGG